MEGIAESRALSNQPDTPASSPNLSIAIVNWNTRDLLADCLRAVFATLQRAAFEVIVLDNASTDGSAEMVRTKFPQVRLMESSENLGFAAGTNRALADACGAYLLLLNPDTVVRDGAVDCLLAALLSNPRLGAVGAQLLNTDGSPQGSFGCFRSVWAEIPLLNRLGERQPQAFTGPDGAKLWAVDWVSGACLMTRRETWAQVGSLDESYWLYTEEVDWCYRARAAGWEIALVPRARVVHARRAASRQRYADATRHFHTSRLHFLKKHRGTMQARLAQAILVGKIAFWIAVPRAAPLARDYPDLGPREVRAAYQTLLPQMATPLDALLARKNRTPMNTDRH